ncbi:MAG: NUDIX hydrolase [Gammaproteobacteria bacterium]|nr:MAG: NUDIX hydrolase [Gammaproteobacteria bacterium]
MTTLSHKPTERWCPRVTVAAVIQDDLGRYLLVEEAPRGTRVLNQPAGHLEPGESLQEAVIREVREETCMAFSPTGVVGVYQWQVAPDGPSYLRFCFSGTATPLDDCRRDPDILALHWLSSDVLAGGQWRLRSPMVMQCIEDAERGDCYPLASLHAMGIGSHD